jgi:hypothetical protein
MSEMRRSRAGRTAAGLLLALAAGAARGPVEAQLALRPDDPLGLALRQPRVRVLHATGPEVPGTSMHLQQADPWLAYQRGRAIFFREWGREDGVFASLSGHAVAAATTSCGMCHNLPFASAGSGGNTVQPLGYGRNAPHLFGAGLLEMLGYQVRAEILAAFDDNRNGFLDLPAETRGRRAEIEAAPGVVLDFGPLDDRDGDGRPDLDAVVKTRPVDARGRPLAAGPAGARPLAWGDPAVAGYDVNVAVFASSAGDHQFPSLRVFTNGALRTVMGMAADDPTSFQQLGPRPDWQQERTWALTSNAGALQPSLPLLAESAQTLARLQGSRRGTLSEGEIDLVEWYLLNHPAPAVARQDEETRRGRRLLDELACTSCHVADWRLAAADPERGLAGDRRFFALEVAAEAASGRLEGRLIRLTEERPGPGGSRLQVPRREGFAVRGVFTDLRHHDLGERFWEHYPAGGGAIYVLRRFRTPPLWGVGSTAPYGHDGRSLTLDEVVRRHGGEAEASAAAYRAVPPADRDALLAFLRSLVLYQPDLLPTDLDGDGGIAERYSRDGLPLGPERFWPELLFRVVPRYRGWLEGPDGDRFFSFELGNRGEAYGEHLAALVDRDRDSVPDLEQPAGAAAGQSPLATGGGPEERR